MSDPMVSFDWAINERSIWAPLVRPLAPYGSSLLEVMRECALRACFERSPGYERRMGVAARVGTAFHLTLRSFAENPRIGNPPVAIMEQARQRFLSELSEQEAQKAKRPRERGLPQDQERVDRALSAVITEALRISEESGAAAGRTHTAGGKGGEASGAGAAYHPTERILARAEVPIKSNDGVFQGRVDRVEYTSEGTTLFDYKSALRDDVPERYERQLQLYAWLWFETFGEWPIKAQVIYPFKDTTHTVAIDREICLRVVEEYRQVLQEMQHETVPDRLAKPGTVCQVCEFRPWCRPFWKWQSSERQLMPSLERARFGFEGDVAEIKIVDHHWMLRVRWRNSKIKIVAPQERFPQLERASVGTHVRAVDMALAGIMVEPLARVTPLSELFIVQ